MKQDKVPSNRIGHLWSIDFWQRAKATEKGKENLLNSVLKTGWLCGEKREIWIFVTHHKQNEMDHRLNIKT